MFLSLTTAHSFTHLCRWLRAVRVSLARCFNTTGLSQMPRSRLSWSGGTPSAHFFVLCSEAGFDGYCAMTCVQQNTAGNHTCRSTKIIKNTSVVQAVVNSASL